MRFVSDFDKELFIMHCSVIFNAFTYTSILTTLYNPFILLRCKKLVLFQEIVFMNSL